LKKKEEEKAREQVKRKPAIRIKPKEDGSKKKKNDDYSEFIQSSYEKKEGVSRKFLKFLPPIPMMMLDGVLPLLGMVQILYLMDLVFSFVFVMTYIVLETNYWYIFIPLPIIEFIHTGYLIWEFFMRSTSRYLHIRTIIFFLSFTQALLFQGFHK